METGVSSASLYPQQPTETALVNIAAMGCRVVEVFLQTRREYTPTYVKRVAEICGQLGLKVHSVHAAASQYEPMLFYSYKRQNLDGQDILKEVLEAGSILGASCYVFHGPLRIANLEGDRLIEGLGMVSEMAANWGLKLALENVSWCAGWSPRVFTWLNKANIPNLYYTFDSKQAQRSGFEPKEFLEVMAHRLINVHLSDGRGGVPGKDMDFTDIITSLVDISYKGPVILEVYGSRIDHASQLTLGWKTLRAQINRSGSL